MIDESCIRNVLFIEKKNRAIKNFQYELTVPLILLDGGPPFHVAESNPITCLRPLNPSLRAIRKEIRKGHHIYIYIHKKTHTYICCSCKQATNGEKTVQQSWDRSTNGEYTNMWLVSRIDRKLMWRIDRKLVGYCWKLRYIFRQEWCHCYGFHNYFKSLHSVCFSCDRCMCHYNEEKILTFQSHKKNNPWIFVLFEILTWKSEARHSSWSFVVRGSGELQWYSVLDMHKFQLVIPIGLYQKNVIWRLL